jgi:serine/threonine protein kinase
MGGFTLIGRLGAGAMGRVYLGRSAAGRLVAVKTIRIEFAEEPDFRTRFANEVAAARRVSGAFTAPVVAADPEADVPWLATAYVPAPSLSTLVQTCGPLSVPAVRWLAAGCAEALESIHGVGLVHRDLKPSNVLVSPDGPRVIDFGVARAAERIQLTMTRGAVGTPAYMAPEQARDTRRATTASDVYSLGATILFAATGHGPYTGDSVMDVLVHLATDAPDISGLPADLTEVVLACLERDPRLRPTSASVLAHLARGDGGADGPFGQAPLPPPVLALIDAYRQDPRPASQPGQRADPDDTLGSIPQPSSPRKSARHSASPRGSLPRQGGTDAARPGPGPDRRGRSRAMLGVGSALAALALVGGGVAAGSYLFPSHIAAASQRSTGGGPTIKPPPTFGGTFYDPTGKPYIKIDQKQGDSFTGFVIEGRDWPPARAVTIRIAGVTRSVRVTADFAGSFNFALNQGHAFFRRPIPPGHYKVIVTEPGFRLTASFMVHAPPVKGQPPPGSPPPGSPPQ